MISQIDIRPHKGAPVLTPWSQHVTILDILLSMTNSEGIFYGVIAQTCDEFGWTLHTSLLWIYSSQGQFRLWQDFVQAPRGIDEDSVVEKIIGHYEAYLGEVYYAVKWFGYACPTWEIEEDLLNKSNILDQYCSNISK